MFRVAIDVVVAPCGALVYVMRCPGMGYVYTFPGKTSTVSMDTRVLMLSDGRSSGQAGLQRDTEGEKKQVVVPVILELETVRQYGHVDFVYVLHDYCQPVLYPQCRGVVVAGTGNYRQKHGPKLDNGTPLRRPN